MRMTGIMVTIIALGLAGAAYAQEIMKGEIGTTMRREKSVSS